MKKICVGLFFGMFSLFVHLGNSQVATGSIAGTIRDGSGAVVPGVTVSVKSLETGSSRTVTTDTSGRYRIPQLNVGSYEVQAEMAGFKGSVRRGISLTVGSESLVDFALELGDVAETVTVTGEAPLVESSGAAISGLVGERQMAELPLNGRSFDQLIITDSGAAYARFAGGGSNQGFGAKFTIGGQRWESNKYYQDGTEMLGASRTADSPGSASGVQLGVDAIREFRVLTSNYSAEYGKKVGGVVTTVTKNGTNEIHGSAFYFHRNDNFDARNFFDPGDLPEFKRNNFGGSLGGPIHKDRMFFFGNYEGLRERKGITKIAIVPDENARRGILPSRTVALAPAVLPYLSIFPLPDGRNFGDGTAESFNPSPTKKNDDYFLGRFDWNVSNNNFFFVSYSTSDGYSDEPLENRFFAEQADTRNHTATIEEKHIFSPTLLNVIRLGFNRSSYFLDTLPLISIDPGLSFHPGLGFGGIEFQNGMTTVGSSTGPNTNANNLYQFHEQMIYSRGSHNLIYGFQFQRLQKNEVSTDRIRGVMRFASLETLLTGSPNRFRGAVPAGIQGTLNVGVSLAPNFAKGWRQSLGGLYVQDEWRILSNLTLELGLRYEFATVPQEVQQKTTRFLIERVTPEARFVRTTPIVGEQIFDNAANLLAPRVGFAWDPFGDTKTSVRGGIGMFYEVVDNMYRFFQDINPPFTTRADFSGALVRFPQPFVGLNANQITVTTRTIDPNIEPATVFHFNLGIQRQLSSNWVAKAAYIGSHGYHLSNSPGVNLAPAQILPNGDKFWAAGLTNANPILGPVEILESNVNSWYNSLKLELEKRFSEGPLGGVRFKWAYTYAKSTDFASTNQNTQAANTPSQTLDPLDLKRDKSLSTFDLRQNLAFNFSYQLPVLVNAGLGRHIANGWMINGLMQANSGFPATAQVSFNRSRNREESVSDRPDLASGANNNPVLGGPDRYFDGTVFTIPNAGFHGNLGRNTLINPGLVNVDFSLIKSIPISESKQIQFRAEFFNLLNRANFGLPNTRLFTTVGPDVVRVGSAGRISSTITDNRQIQFGLRYEF